MSKNIAIYSRAKNENKKILIEQSNICVNFAEKLFSNYNVEFYQDIIHGIMYGRIIYEHESDDRSYLEDMLFDIDEKKIDVVIINTIDRLSRNINDLERIFNIADENNVPIYEAETGKLLNFQNSLDKAIAHLLAKNEINPTVERLKTLFDYQIYKTDTKEIKEYLKNLKEDFVSEFY